MTRTQFRTRIKFCGMTRAGDIRLASELGVDAIGFVFARGSSRRVAPVEARAMRSSSTHPSIAPETVPSKEAPRPIHPAAPKPDSAREYQQDLPTAQLPLGV